MRQRIDAGQLVGALGALLLLASLFVDWFQPDITGWKVFEVLDLVLAGLALGALVPFARSLSPHAPPGPRRDLLLIGAAALVVVASQLIQHPPAAIGLSPDTGAWLGLAGAAAMALGGVLATANVSLAVNVEPREPASRPAAPAPATPPAGDRPVDEAAAAEPEVQDELYPEPGRSGPIGSDDPEPWHAGPDDETEALGDDPSPPRS